MCLVPRSSCANLLIIHLLRGSRGGNRMQKGLRKKREPLLFRAGQRWAGRGAARSRVSLAEGRAGGCRVAPRQLRTLRPVSESHGDVAGICTMGANCAN